MKQVKTFQFWMALICMQGILVGSNLTSARADATSDQFHAYCDADLASSETTTAGNLDAACQKAKYATKAKSVEKTKMLLYGIGSGICFGLSLPPVAAWAGPACAAISLGATGTGFVLDKANKTALSQGLSSFSSSMSSTIDTLGAVSSGVGLALQAGWITSFNIPIVNVKLETNTSGKSSCIQAGAGLAAEFAISFISKTSADSVYNNSVKSAAGAYTVGHPGITITGTTPIAAPDNNVTDPNNSVGGSSGDCSTKSGNAYLSCVAQISPEVAALTSSPTFMSAAQKALGDQNLGDFVKNAQADTPQQAANSIGSAMGVDPSLISKGFDAGKQLASDAGLTDAYVPVAYVQSGGSKGASTDSLDFGKLMSDTLKSLNPDAANDKSANASDLVFRQLDLLPASKIEANKDISLFARVGYRYRKTSDKVESLNWAGQQNQSPTARTPASATSTTTATKTTQ